MKVIFPEKDNQKYYGLHVQYLINIFRYVNIDVTYRPMTFVNETAFPCMINGERCIIDFSDSGTSIVHADHPVFKFHCKELSDGIFPLPPISFHDWSNYYKLKKTITYTCNNDTILNNQVPYGNAKDRRDYIRELLKMKYPGQLDSEISDQLDYWDKINNCLCHVFVPGQNNNMLDRGQIQFLAFGCCTISPNLPEYFPFNKKLEPDVHYLMCDDRYREVGDKIEWVKANREMAIEIGQNAKTFFKEHMSPPKVVEWMDQCIKR